MQFTSLAQQGWFEQESGTDSHLNSVFFLDSLNGWVAGDSTILKTTNGGTDWVIIPSGFNYNYNDVFFISDSVGWVAGGTDFFSGGIILKTTDGGTNWYEQISNFPYSITSLDFFSENIGWALGDGVILKTIDGGIIWSIILESFLLKSHSFIDTVYGWAAGNVLSFCWVINTIDGGNNWTTQYTSPFYWFNSVNFIDEQNGWIVGSGNLPYDPGILLKTTNGGDVWTVDSIEYSQNLNSVFFINKMSGYIAGSRGELFEAAAAIFFSSDGGTSWSVQYEDSTSVNELNSIYIVDENIGWATGNNGMILKTTNGGVTFVEEEEFDEIATNYTLSQNYPNPFNPSTTIKYSVPQSSNVSIKVFDILGSEIETLVNEEKAIGTYEISWYAEQLPSGIYFYRIRAGSFVETKKMVLMK